MMQNNVTMLLQVIGRLCKNLDSAAAANSPDYDPGFAARVYSHATNLLWEIVGDNSIEFLEYEDARF